MLNKNNITKSPSFKWNKKRVLITGGASFIGSSLADGLLLKDAKIKIVDNLSSGKIENINSHIRKGHIEFIRGDLRDSNLVKKAMKGIDIIIHLAADHGGRGYVDLHQAGPSSNLLLDGLVFLEAMKANVEKIVFASSGCVYPNYLQKKLNRKIFLKENMVTPPYDADNLYGWAKLMGELTLKAYSKEYGIKTASCRYFTVYGPRGVENHAVIAMIAKAFINQDPFEVWGNGKQIRNWTYIDDIVRGTILTAEKIDNGTAINLGTMERIRVIDAVKEILAYTNFNPKIKFLTDMPTGPVNRVADNKLAEKLIGWEPEVPFKTGVRKTIDWYFSSKNKRKVEKYLSTKLINR